jgi:hypothetical protein
MIKLFHFVTAAALGLALGTLSNMAGAEPDAAFAAAVQRDMEAGFTGNAEAFERGMRACEDRLAENPNDATAMVWHGAGTYFRASKSAEAGRYEEATTLMDRGAAEMGKAVTLVPDNMTVRITRGMVYVNAARFGAPDPDTLYSLSAADFEKVVEVVGPGWEQLPANLRAEILLGLGDSYANTGRTEKARRMMEKVKADHSGTPQAERAGQWLDRQAGS